MRKSVGIILFVFLASLFLVGCGSQESTSTTGSEKVDEVEEASEEVAVYGVGDFVTINDLDLTITSAKFTDPQEFSDPENGAVLTLTVEAVNNGTDKLMVDNMEFNLYDLEGNSLKQYYGYNGVAISGSINSGKKLTGELYFDVTTDEQFELIYTSSWSGDGTELKFIIVPE